MTTTVAVFVGGVVGTSCRYGLGLALPTAGFPWATFVANVLGSFLLAFIYELAARSALISSTIRIGLGVGVMGGFTTYSSFNLEVLRALGAGHAGLAVAYFAATLVACLGGAVGAVALVRLFSSGRGAR